ncbi:chitin synthase regulatory factor chr2 [Gigaspora margarita]|uniref:non-specific serine/threonine protein kinase n=1 Tax=Gigaspora margarita TaxID=4874 RepID=A0A8H3X943_GIGMA|nr:chitin synthase regulatory factor chr2 [Gigaspora margarita]
MSGNENNNYLTTNETKYLTTRRVYNETIKAYIERIIKENIINFIRWNEINEKTEFLDYGGEGVIIKAKWIEKNITVALKAITVIEETDSDNDEFIKEIKAFHHISIVYSSITNEENKEKISFIGYENVIKFFGLSSNEYDFYLVLEYGDLGNLRYYLRKNIINWEQKVNIARQITDGLYFLHKNEILHRDLHTKNVVIKKDGDGVKAIITDFGLSKVLPRNSKSNQQRAGYVAFIGPEILNSDAIHNYKSDIYSLGIVLWEITSNGRPPFSGKSEIHIIFEIIKGVREHPIEGSTISYVKLYTDCWDENPKSRPNIEQIYKLIHQEEIITGEKWKDSSQSYIHDTDIGQTTFIEKESNKDENVSMAIYSEVKNAPKKLDFRVLSNFFQEEFDNSSEDQKLVKEWKLNHGLYLAGKNFIPSSRIILGYNGKLDVVTYSGEPLVYAVVNNNSDKPRSLWDKLRDSYPRFSTTKESPVNDIFETDICLLFPIAEITYDGPINKGFMRKIDSRNFANAKPVQIENLKSHLALALDSYHLRIENPFENASIFDFPIIETTNKNFLKTPKDLAKWIRRVYEDNVAEIITYEEIVPIFTFLGKVNHIDNSNAFINRLVPGISSKHQEITLKDWIDIPLRNLLTWINKLSFRHGMLINQFGISLAKNQALTFTQTPIVSKRNNYYLKLIQPETRMEEILLRNNITHKLTSIPFLEYLSTTKIGDFYLFLNKEKIEISLDQCVAPLPVFTEAVEDAIRSIHPYRALQKVFNKFGYFFLNSAVLGSQLREILKKQMNISIQSLPEKKFVASSQEDIDKILEYTKDLNLNYLLTPNGQVVMMNQIFDWFNEFGNNDEKLKLIKIDQITPLYKILNYKLQIEIETILENRSDPRILLTGIKTFDVDDNFTKAFIRIDFDHSVLDSSSYDVFGVILDSEGIISQRCAVNFDLFDCYGFSAFVTFEDNTAKNIRGWNIIWMVIGNPFLLGAFSANYRETKTMFHKALVDLTACYDDMMYIHLPFTLAKNSIVLLSALYPPSNNPPKDFRLIRWSKDILELKIATLNIDQTRPSTFYLNICAVYPREEMIFKVDFGEKIVTYNLFGHNIDDNNYDHFIDFNFYKNIYLNHLNVEFPHIIKRRLPDLIQNYGGDIPFEAYFMQEVKHENLVKYIDILETETTFLLITELDYSIRSTSWTTLHHYLKHNGALFENQAKNIFKQIIECISFIYKHGFRNININDRNILIFESQIKLFNMENLISDELTDGLVYDIQYEDDYNISYASPEMISGHNYNPEFSDLWSLGILLYTMIHADVPFKKPFDTITRTLMIEKEISKECSNILHRLLAKKSHLRGSFKSLLNDSWIGINTFSKRRISNNLKGSTDKNIIIEKASKNETIHELDELIEESQNNIGSSLSLQWIPSNSLKDMKLIGKGGFGSIATGKHIYGANNNDKPSFDESIPSFYQNMIHSCCDKEPSNRPNAQTLTNEIIDWKLNKMHQFNDKKRLLSYLSKEAEETVEKLQTDIIPDPDIIENDENNDIYSKMKSDSMKSNAFVKTYNKAIDGDSEAMKNVAICLLNGNGIEKDMNEAFSWCMKCFRKNIVFTREELIPLAKYFSQDSLDLERKIKFARMLECGLGVDKDFVNAYLIYKNAAESGHAHAQFITGKYCEKGLGRKKDLREAFNWFIKAINQNYSDAFDYINERYVTSFKQQGISVNIECTIYSNEGIVTGKATKTIVKDKIT